MLTPWCLKLPKQKQDTIKPDTKPEVDNEKVMCVGEYRRELNQPLCQVSADLERVQAVGAALKTEIFIFFSKL